LLVVLTSNQFKSSLLFKPSGDIVHVDKPGRLNVDVVLKSLFMRFGEFCDDMCNRLDPETAMNVSWGVDNTF
jgi:hypothetical protein